MKRLIATFFVSLSTVNMIHADDLVAPAVLDHLGLKQSWARPVTAPWGAPSIVNQQLVVMEDNPVEYLEIIEAASDAAPAEAEASADPAATEETTETSDQRVIVRMRVDTTPPNGHLSSREEAERRANNEIRRLKRKGIDAELRSRKIPRVNLFSLSDNGTLESRDAETGEPLWMIHLGDPQLPYMELGADQDHLIVVNGSNIHQIDTQNGEIISSISTIGAPAFGATIAGDFVMVPMIGGGIECYPLRDPTIDPFLEKVEGDALSLPVKSPDIDSSRTAWATDRGFVYVMEMQGVPSLLFRLKTDGIVSARIAAAKGNRFFFGSEGGQVYGIRATRSGEVMWSTPIGEPFYHEPLVFGDQVLLRSAFGSLFSLDAATGALTWEKPLRGVGELIGVIDGNLYTTTLSGHCEVVELSTGKRVSTPLDLRPADFIVNTMTNRLYLVGDEGDVQCVHAVGEDLPTFHHELAKPLTVEESVNNTGNQPNQNGKGAGGGNDPFGAGGNDPFGAGGNDPFGAGMNNGGNDPFGAGGNDPFGGAGGGNDPFGGGEAMEDPFGANPFGN
ncbi:PQQ-like beta-propeller repeat protein [Rhodopirellula sp.]|jgi:outer membrane protein assembly factor BamB|nr:PQQ-like beta-propeller repeat protein [Rhodopirellula sp.]MDA9778042.1 PQQ-like beta-propeller repeat protein [Rubripirellula sp.]